jgi:hypothetical protein
MHVDTFCHGGFFFFFLFIKVENLGDKYIFFLFSTDL